MLNCTHVVSKADVNYQTITNVSVAQIFSFNDNTDISLLAKL